MLLCTACSIFDKSDQPAPLPDMQPVASFSIIGGNCSYKLGVAFHNISTGNNLRYHWDFGDGATSNERDASHMYSERTSYNIRLIVSNSLGSDTAEDWYNIGSYSPPPPPTPRTLTLARLSVTKALVAMGVNDTVEVQVALLDSAGNVLVKTSPRMLNAANQPIGEPPFWNIEYSVPHLSAYYGVSLMSKTKHQTQEKKIFTRFYQPNTQTVGNESSLQLPNGSVSIQLQWGY